MVYSKDWPDGYELNGNKPVRYGSTKKIARGVYFVSTAVRKDMRSFYFELTAVR
jgi:hypothetical protein